jgi:hypothetical protein
LRYWCAAQKGRVPWVDALRRRHQASGLWVELLSKTSDGESKSSSCLKSGAR